MDACPPFFYTADGTLFWQPLCSGCRRSSWYFLFYGGRYVSGIAAARVVIHSPDDQAVFAPATPLPSFERVLLLQLLHRRPHRRFKPFFLPH
jgi:hypothetical protein